MLELKIIHASKRAQSTTLVNNSHRSAIWLFFFFIAIAIGVNTTSLLFSIDFVIHYYQRFIIDYTINIIPMINNHYISLYTMDYCFGTNSFAQTIYLFRVINTLSPGAPLIQWHIGYECYVFNMYRQSHISKIKVVFTEPCPNVNSGLVELSLHGSIIIFDHNQRMWLIIWALFTIKACYQNWSQATKCISDLASSTILLIAEIIIQHFKRLTWN